MILAHAVDIASVDGLEAVTIGRLAEASGLSKSGLFSHFASKETLQIELLRSAAQRFVEAVVQTRRRRFGAAKVLRELKDKGVSEDGLAEAREALADGEMEAARSVWQKKFGEPPVSLAERAKQTRFLAGRGFSSEVIRKILDWGDD